jgi:1-acyl-sn-glycerol-3-phosphate acyltransferase
MAWLIDDAVLERADRLELPWSRHGIDPYGIDKTEVARMMTLSRWFYRRYFSVTVRGIEHIPARGRAMLVGNHSGGFAIDGMMIAASAFFDKEPPRLAQGMTDKFINRLPLASMMSSRTGNFTGTPENAVHLLKSDRLLMVFPEGSRGTAKLYGERHSLVRFGTGFMRLAVETGTPIVPVAVVGGGDAVPTVANLYRLGKLFGVPYIPITPYLLPIPRPVALEIYYGPALRYEGTGNEEDDVIRAWVGEVVERIGEMLDAGVRRRAAGLVGEDRDGRGDGGGDRAVDRARTEDRS